jgi:hypothetical protein
LVEVTEVMFKLDDWAWELILCLLDVLKNDFVEVDEAMFQSVERLCEIIFCILGIERTDLDGRLSDGLSRPIAVRSHNLPSVILKMKLVMMKRCFKVSKGH